MRKQGRLSRMADLRELNVRRLQTIHRELFGLANPVPNCQHLRRKVAWHICKRRLKATSPVPFCRYAITTPGWLTLSRLQESGKHIHAATASLDGSDFQPVLDRQRFLGANLHLLVNSRDTVLKRPAVQPVCYFCKPHTGSWWWARVRGTVGDLPEEER